APLLSPPFRFSSALVAAAAVAAGSRLVLLGAAPGRRAVAGKGHQLHQAAAHCVPDGWHLQGCHADGRDARTGRDGVAQQGFLLRRLGAQPDERVRGAQLRGRFLLRGPMVGEHGERQGALSA
ncbi:unnamed protein product, partial [Prorocentrum cordatum]